MMAFWTDLIVELLLRNHTPFLIFVNLCVKRSRSLISHAILHWHFCVNYNASYSLEKIQHEQCITPGKPVPGVQIKGTAQKARSFSWVPLLAASFVRVLKAWAPGVLKCSLFSKTTVVISLVLFHSQKSSKNRKPLFLGHKPKRKKRLLKWLCCKNRCFEKETKLVRKEQTPKKRTINLNHSSL